MLRKKFFLLILISVLLSNCAKEKDESINVAIYQAMKEWYLWYQHIPEVDPTLYTTPTQLLEAIKYKEIDRWSFIITSAEYEQYYIQGKYYGHGFGYGFDNQSQVRISYIFKNSDLYKAGVQRGWIIKKINNNIVTPQNINNLLGENKAGITNSFTFSRPQGNDTLITSVKKEVAMQMVLLDTIFQINDRKVGYLVLFSFIANAAKELEDVFGRFKSNGINELILDLRYNSGGFTDIGLLLASFIAANNYDKELFCKFIHNDKKTNMDTSLILTKQNNSISLSRLFVITTNKTASTSEIIINGLRPYLTVYTIGNKTEGKPVGMDVLTWTNHSYYLFPITFKIVNANNEGDYYNGIPVNAITPDDLTHNFGDIQESCLNNALYFITNNKFLTSTRTFETPTIKPVLLTWWDREFGAY